MELKTQALERLLEAISPALASELDRMTEEMQQKFELDLQERLGSALRVAESTTHAAQSQLERAVAEVREETRREVAKVTHDLQQEFHKTLEETASQLKSEAAAERARLQEQLDQWRVLAEAQRQLAQASSQAEILARLLRFAEPFAAGVAIYVAKAGGLALWKSRGKSVFPETISEDAVEAEFYFKVVSVRGKKIAAVCAAPPYKAETLEFLVSSMEVAVEVFGLKLRASAAKPSPAPEPGENDASRLGTAYPGL